MSSGTRRGRPPYPDILTPAEWRVVHLAQHGLSNQEIARRRGVSLDAVKLHIANARAKLRHAALPGARRRAGGAETTLVPLPGSSVRNLGLGSGVSNVVQHRVAP